MRKYYITDYGLTQVEIAAPTLPGLEDFILHTLADFPEGMTKTEIIRYLNREETAENAARFQKHLNNLMDKEFVVYEDE